MYSSGFELGLFHCNISSMGLPGRVISGHELGYVRSPVASLNIEFSMTDALHKRKENPRSSSGGKA